MTRHQYTQTLARELQKINERIDYKILHGQRYTDDSKRHKILLERFNRQRRRLSFFARMAHVMTLF